MDAPLFKRARRSQAPKTCRPGLEAAYFEGTEGYVSHGYLAIISPTIISDKKHEFSEKPLPEGWKSRVFVKSNVFV